MNCLSTIFPDCPPGWIEYNSVCYKWIRAKFTWFEAFDVCKANNGNLAGIPDEDVNEFLREYIPDGQAGDYCWIGGFEHDEGFWAWDDGRPWGYQNWKEGEPNHVDGNTEDCLSLITWNMPDLNEEPGLWDDLDCDLPMSFICVNSK